MNYLLIDTNPRMVEAWRDFFKEEENVKIYEGDLCKVTCDAIVSPANSFGFMDGGVDYAISERLGWDLQVKLQQKIRALPEKELLIGKAMVIQTKDDRIPYLISAPTMRVPMSFQISRSINAYLAMKAVLIEAIQHEKINTVAIPGFCTGVGKMSPIISARQMYFAFKEIEKKETPDIKNFSDAQKYQWEINPQGMIHE